LSTKENGRGLGLAAVRGIVRSHGGTLEVRSEAGLRASFRYDFPVTARRREPTPDDRERDPRLDGVRGIAILLVLVCHLTQYGGMAPNGPFLDRLWRTWTLPLGLGVDLFFVLSGFLITGILLDTKDGPDYFRNFYARRFLRIFPLYYATLAATFLLIPAVGLDAVWYWTYLINYRFADVGWPRVAYLGHFWTLAVEEQFYLVWPALVFFVPRRVLPWLCVAAVTYSICGRMGTFHAELPAYANLATHLRLDALAIGGLLACLARRPQGLTRLRRPAIVVFWLCAAAAVYFFSHENDATPMMAERVFKTTVLGLGFGAFILLGASAAPTSRLRAALCAPWLTRVGLYSYSLYVIHHVIVIGLHRHHLNVKRLPSLFGSQLPAQFLFDAVVGGLCVALSALSYHQLESRFLALKRHFRYRKAAQPPPVRAGAARAV
jgi:peptidoglycan/LPS O-acetylase OafA/YrhL